jgi:uncharacterized protein YlxP (DUF503 family)
MVIGLLRVRLHLPQCHSLKEKRSILKRLIHRLRTNQNCAVAETNFQDTWQTAELSAVTVYAEKSTVESLLLSLERQMEGQDDFEVVAREIEFL